MVILNSLQSVFTIVIMISVGYVLTHKGWFDDNISTLFSKLVIDISLPVYMIYYLSNNFDKDKLSSLRSGMLIPFLAIGLCCIIGIMVSKLINVSPKRRGVFQNMFFTSNTIFIGLPVNTALFGDKSIPYVLLYYVANTAFFWTIGIYNISSDSEGKSSNIFSFNLIKKILSPPLLGFLTGFLLIQLGIQLPKFINDSFKYVGNLTTPLSMLVIGITIYNLDPKTIRLDKDMLALFCGRFIISPLIVFYLVRFFPIPSLMKSVFVIQAGLPAASQTAIVAKKYNADYEYASAMMAITTIVSLIFIPIYMLILS